MENVQIAEIFHEIADLLELRQGNAFRIRSYRNAAQTMKKILKASKTVATTAGRLLYQEAADHLASLKEHLDALAETDRILAAVKSGVVHCLGHPLGRIIGRRDPNPVDLDKIIEACIEHNVRLEINAQPDRLDLPDYHVQHAREAGATFTLGTDAHTIDGFRFMPFGINVARRGWLRKGDVLNTKSTTELKKELRK